MREKQEDMVVIFITGVKEYVFEAFDVSAFHYLLKPVEEKKFSEVFERAKKEVEKRTTQGKKTFLSKPEIGALPLTMTISCILKTEEKKWKYIPVMK